MPSVDLHELSVCNPHRRVALEQLRETRQAIASINGDVWTFTVDTSASKRRDPFVFDLKPHRFVSTGPA